MRTIWLLALASISVSAIGIGAAAYLLERIDRTPRELAPNLVHRAEDHRPLIVNSAAFAAGVLERMDRMANVQFRDPTSWVGASETASRTGASDNSLGPHHLVDSVESLTAALNAAEPGDIIEIKPGRYRIEGGGLRIDRPGRPDAPITVRAERLGSVVLESRAIEAIKVSAQNWHFENLVLRGLCDAQNDRYCEHAFHIVGGAQGTVIRNNVITDFNAQIKINGEGGAFPDYGIIEGNTLQDGRPRQTANPVTPIDLDAASGWLITGNLISDFIKSGGNRVSYGAFAKAAGQHNSFERNVVLCEHNLEGKQGTHVGISLGGGGSDPKIRRDGGRSGLEQDGSRVSDNLIAFCSDAGIYLNRSGDSQVDHNTLLDTSGIIVRFPESSARLDENIVDGIISIRDGASASSKANLVASLLGLYLGLHSPRRLFSDPAHLDLTWKGAAPLGPESDSRPDLCGTKRALHAVVGAFENFANCLHRGAVPGGTEN
jgi:parallel beta-helix repeat protein